MGNIERRRTENALRESENWRHSLVAAMAEGVVLQDSNGQIVTCNQSAERILGLTLEQMKGRTSVDPRWRPIHEDGSPFPGDTHPAAVTLKTGVPQVDVIMGVHKPDGTLTWISINTQPIVTAAAAAPDAVVSSFRDITRIRLAEEALRKSAAEIKDLYNRAPCGYHSLDKNGLFIQVNDTELEWLGYARDEIVGKMHVFDLMTPGSARIFHDNFGAFKTRGWVHGLELEMVRRTGTILPVLLNATMVTDSNGHFVMTRSTLYDITERKQSEAALRESEARLQAFLDHSPSVMFTKDLDGRYLHVNAQFRRHFGLEGRQIAGSTDDDLFSPYQAAIFRANDREVIARGAALEFEETVDYVDGSRTNIVCKFPIPDAAGNIAAIGGIATDITERIEAAAARARLAAIVESSQDAIFSRSLDGKIYSWNAGAERLYGYTAAEAIGQQVSFLVPPDRKHEHADNWKRLIRGQPVPPYETVRVTKDGRRIDVSLSLSPIKDSVGNVTGVAAITHDITERKRAEETRAKLAAIVENANEAIISRALDGTILSWNAAAERMFGFTAAEAVDHPVTMILPPERHSLVGKHTEALLAGEPLVPVETTRVTKDGRIIDVVSSLSPIRNDHGELIAAAIIIQDITERKRAAEEIRRLNQELELRVQQRTAELAESRADFAPQNVGQQGKFECSWQGSHRHSRRG